MQRILSAVGGLCMLFMGMEVLSSSLSRLFQPKQGSVDACGGFLTGLFWTIAAQSSSAVTACLISLTEAGVFLAGDCFPILLGANVGTTVTVWLFSGLRAVSLRGTGLLPMIVALLLRKRPDASRACMGLSLVLLGMELMGDAVVIPLWIRSGLDHVPSALLTGLTATAVLQSSAVTIGLLQTMEGLTVKTAAAAVLGANIGTTVTGLLASAMLGKKGKQTAWMEVFINVAGSAIMLPAVLLMPSSDVSPSEIAALHTLCNVIPAALLLPLTERLKKVPIRRSGWGDKFIREGAAGQPDH